MYLDRVKVTQRRDPQLQKVMINVQQGQSRDFVIDNKGTLRMGTKLCVRDVHKLRKEIFVQVFCLSAGKKKILNVRGHQDYCSSYLSQSGSGI